jgi:hypothetical protein
MSIEKLLQRVVGLEDRLGLNSEGQPYSDRLLALIDALENDSWSTSSTGFQGQLNRLKEFVDEDTPASSGEESGTVEGAVSTLEDIVHNRRAADRWSGEDSVEYVTFQQKVRGTNINETTLLATDYLNHFNEVVMLLDMLPDMPDMLEDVKEWKPKTYQQHFLDSTFAEKELAVEAYAYVPAPFKRPFETTVDQLDRLIANTVEHVSELIEKEDVNHLKEAVSSNSILIQRLLDNASGIIHGSMMTMDQTEIDAFIG